MAETIIIKLLKFANKHSKVVIGITVFITLVLGFFAVQVQLNPDIEGLIPDDEQVTQLMEKYLDGVDQVDSVFIALESENVFDLEKLQALQRGIDELLEIPEFETCISPFNFLTFQNGGTGSLLPAPVSPNMVAPQNEEELALFKANITTDPFVERLLISEDHNTLNIIFLTNKIKDYPEVNRIISKVRSDLDLHFNTYITGTIPFFDLATNFLKRDLVIMVSLAALIILVMYYFGFRSKRAVILPFLVVMIGTIWCLGFMQLMGFAITIVSLATPPLVLTLGSSYTIHILNQYYREVGNAKSQKDTSWISNSVAHINKTVFLAAMTTVAGFAALLVTEMDQTREFGMATSVGVISCALLSLFFLPAVLSNLSNPSDYQQKRVAEGRITKTFKNMTPWLMKHKLVVLLMLVVVIVGFGISLQHVKYDTQWFNYFPDDEPLIKDMHYFAEHIGGVDELYITLTAPEEEPNFFKNRENLQAIRDFEKKVQENPDVGYLLSFPSYLEHLNYLKYGEQDIPKNSMIQFLGRNLLMASSFDIDFDQMKLLINEDYSRMTISLRIYNAADMSLMEQRNLVDLLDQIEEYNPMLPEGVKVEVWSLAMRFISLADMMSRDQQRSLLISVLIIFAITGLAFRSLKYGFFSLIPLFIGIMLNYIIMLIFGIPFDMTTVMVSCVAVGVGVDNSIHFLIQYRKQLREDPDNIEKAITDTLGIAGRPIVLTTISIIGGMMVFCFASFKPEIYFGLLISVIILTTAIGTLLVLPVFLMIDWSIKQKFSKKQIEKSLEK